MDVVDIGVFARAWAVQTRRIAWLLGAGASAAAGVPTAARIIDDLLLRLYADAFGLTRQALDATDPVVVARVHAYFDNAQGLPALDAPEAYSRVFEVAMPDAATRREYLRQLLSGRAPCFGQRVLGAAVVAGEADLVMTTNFDELVERAVAEAHASAGTEARLLSVAALGSVDRAAASFADEQWPLLIKLHGDFREMHLKNLDAELQEQDARLRRAVIDGSRRFGLAVAGYSGRDASVMDMLRDACREPDAWPAGLWWLTRDPDRLPGNVRELMTEAADARVKAHIVHAENFDEVMGALAAQVDLAPSIRAYLDGLRPRGVVSDAPLPAGPSWDFPVLRLNALPVLEAPTKAWVISTPAMTAHDLRTKLSEGSWRGAAVLGGGQVVAFGSSAHLARCVGADQEPDAVNVSLLSDKTPAHLRGLAAEALTRGIARRLSARPYVRDRGANRLVLLPAREGEPEAFADVRRRLAEGLEGELTGTLPLSLGRNPEGAPRGFAEAIRLRLEFAFGSVWLLFIPFTWTEPTAEAVAASKAGRRPPVDPAADWKRERWVQRRRNEQWARIIAAWSEVIAPHRPTSRVWALPRSVADLPDALGGSFTIGSTTAYSRRVR